MTQSFHKEEPNTRIESGTSTNPVDIVKGIIKKIPHYWLSKIGVKKLIKSLPNFRENLEIPDSDMIFSWIKGICQTPHRRPGTPEHLKAEEWVLNELNELGLENITKDPIQINVWSAKKWSLRVDGKEIPSFFVVNTGFTDLQGITAPLIYVGKGRTKDFKKLDVSGKIVVAEVSKKLMKQAGLRSLPGN